MMALANERDKVKQIGEILTGGKGKSAWVLLVEEEVGVNNGVYLSLVGSKKELMFFEAQATGPR